MLHFPRLVPALVLNSAVHSTVAAEANWARVGERGLSHVWVSQPSPVPLPGSVHLLTEGQLRVSYLPRLVTQKPTEIYSIAHRLKIAPVTQTFMHFVNIYCVLTPWPAGSVLGTPEADSWQRQLVCTETHHVTREGLGGLGVLGGSALPYCV